jgi:hypothetical protein
MPSGDTVPARIGGAVLRCAGSFDLNHVDWVKKETSRGRIWYWLANSSTSPWYPSMRIFSQKKPGDWREPVAQAARELARFTKPR